MLRMFGICRRWSLPFAAFNSKCNYTFVKVFPFVPSTSKTVECLRLYCGRSSATIKATEPSSVKENLNRSYLHHVGKNPLVYRTVGQELERAADNFGQKEAIVSCHEGRRYTFHELLREADRVAASLLKLGLESGDRIGLWGPNNLSWYLSMLGATRAGLISVGINPAFQAPEVEYVLKKVNVKALVCPQIYRKQQFYKILCSICPELIERRTDSLQPLKSANLPHLCWVIMDNFPAPLGTLSFTEFLNLSNDQDQNNIQSLQNNIKPDSACNIQFTSGTTGQPKAALLSHFNFVNNGLHIGSRNNLHNQRICVQVPLFHAFGVVITIMAAMSYGATLVLPSAHFDPEASLHSIVKEKCTVVHGTPTMHVDLISKQKELNMHLDTLNMAVTGGAPCSPQLHREMLNVLGVKEIRNIFGLTETTAAAFQSRPGDTIEQILYTVGHLQDNIEAKIIDSEGNVLPFGEPGELCIRGYSTFLGYYNDAVKTADTIGPDKWLRTGDQFILQADGYGRIVGRLKEMIIRGGENIFPKEIEDFLNTHPDIMEAHVIGVPDERMGEEICAFLRLRKDAADINAAVIKEYAKDKMAHFKVPRYVLKVDDFPKTTSGKIQKFRLLEQFTNLQAYRK